MDILAFVASLPVTVVVALHDLNLAAMFCDAVVLLRGGQVVAAGLPETVLTASRIEEVFGVKALVDRSVHHGRMHVQFLPATGIAKGV